MPGQGKDEVRPNSGSPSSGPVTDAAFMQSLITAFQDDPASVTALMSIMQVTTSDGHRYAAGVAPMSNYRGWLNSIKTVEVADRHRLFGNWMAQILDIHHRSAVQNIRTLHLEMEQHYRTTIADAAIMEPTNDALFTDPDSPSTALPVMSWVTAYRAAHPAQPQRHLKPQGGGQAPTSGKRRRRNPRQQGGSTTTAAAPAAAPPNKKKKK